MALLKVVAVKDLSVQAFLRPIPIPHTGGAIREFADAVNNPEHEFSKHPEDYEIYYLSDFQEETGIFIPLEEGVPRLLNRAIDLLRSGQDVLPFCKTSKL